MPWTHDTQPRVFARGPFIVSIESLFWHPQRYPSWRVARHRPPLTEPARPRELEQPYRLGHGRIFRVPLTRRAVVLGYWEPPGDAVLEEEESATLMSAVNGAMVPGITATEIGQWQGVRDWTWLQLVLRRLMSFLPSNVLERFMERLADADEAVAEEELGDWLADAGWSLRTWPGKPDGDPIIDLEQARVDRAGA